MISAQSASCKALAIDGTLDGINQLYQSNTEFGQSSKSNRRWQETPRLVLHVSAILLAPCAPEHQLLDEQIQSPVFPQ